MIANRVKETTTSTGVGDLALAGAVANFRTFNAAIGIGRRFTYWIVDPINSVWETGIGYLSASTTLVRETVRGNSSGTTSTLNLAAGSKDVFIAPSESGFFAMPPREITANNQRVSSHVMNTSTTFAHVATRIVYYPFVVERAMSVSGIGVYVQTGAGSAADHLLLGLYDTTGNNYPGALLAEASLDPSVTGFNSGTFPAIDLSPGIYWVGIWSNVAPSIRSTTVQNMLDVGLGYDAGMTHKVGFRDVFTGITAMPDPAGVGMTTSQGSTTASIYLEEA